MVNWCPSPMASGSSTFAPSQTRRFLALLACALLLYFAVGACAHDHNNGLDTSCQVCRVLHSPALPATVTQVFTPIGPVERCFPARGQAVRTDSFPLSRTSRAPPSA